MIDKIRERLEEFYNTNNKSKKKAYEEHDWETFNMFSCRNEGVYMAIGIVNQVEAEYNNGWIYCSSGQIPKDDDYILYCGNHLANMEVDCCIGEWFLNHLEYMLAWQPLPQPPKGE